MGLTPVGGLRSDAAEPLAGWARFCGSEDTARTWGELLHSVRTGESAYRHVHGMDAWEYRATHPESAAVFDAAMTDLSRRTNRSLLEAYDFFALRHGGRRRRRPRRAADRAACRTPAPARRPLRPAERRRARPDRRACSDR